ncbi:MAG: hypothetical protein HXX20_13090 [Chloroflexi bacterium]|nr:hypothetical protein [Chloroflexota bacterium]NWJ96713.1 hypothetical protein [Chloroflexota bacterium]
MTTEVVEEKEELVGLYTDVPIALKERIRRLVYQGKLNQRTVVVTALEIGIAVIEQRADVIEPRQLYEPEPAQKVG